MEKNLCFVLLFWALFQACTTSKSLENCAFAGLQTKELRLAKYSYVEELKELAHLSEPWETSIYRGKGDFWITASSFQRLDTLVSERGRSYISKTDFRNDVLLYLDYGDKELLPLTSELWYEKLIQTARYSPTLVFQFFLKNEKVLKAENSQKHRIYTHNIGDFSVKLFLNKSNGLVDKVSYLTYDELYGDVTTAFIYSSYVHKGNLTYPSTITIEKINGKVIDKVDILAVEASPQNTVLLERPEDYKILEEKTEVEKPELKVAKYNDYIHFIDLPHTDDRVLVVEFDDYMLVAEAPINAKNGELILSEVRKIAPSKPIRYFLFGHHHPHYLGGLRAFVHKDATILCTDLSKTYVEYIANAPHTLQADSLQLEPKKLKTQVIVDSLVLGTDHKMGIYFIGDKSAHTKDYLIYYFPNEKLLFQDDLCWMAKEGAITKAGSRQAGLYNSIKALNLEVDTVIQSWPVNNLKVKTIIPFADLEKSVEMER